MCESLKKTATFAHYRPLFRFQGPNSYLYFAMATLYHIKLLPTEAAFFMPRFLVKVCNLPAKINGKTIGFHDFSLFLFP